MSNLICYRMILCLFLMLFSSSIAYLPVSFLHFRLLLHYFFVAVRIGLHQKFLLIWSQGAAALQDIDLSLHSCFSAFDLGIHLYRSFSAAHFRYTFHWLESLQLSVCTIFSFLMAFEFADSPVLLWWKEYFRHEGGYSFLLVHRLQLKWQEIHFHILKCQFIRSQI